MTFDQATIAGLAALATAAGLLLTFGRRALAERRRRRQQAIAAVRAGRLPLLPPPVEMKVAAKEAVHIRARAVARQLEPARELGLGMLAVSDRRIFFAGTRKLRLSWKKIASVELDRHEGVLVRGKDGRRFAFLLARGEDGEMIGEILRVLAATLVTAEVPAPAG